MDVPLRPALAAVVSALAVAVVSAAAPPVLLEPLNGRQLFPASNWWNQDASAAPLDSRSAQFVSWIGTTRQLHPDFGPPPYGIPYIVVAGDQARVPVTFEYDDESDTGVPGLSGYPIPEEAKTQPHFIEGDVPGGGTSGDRHLLIVDRDRWLLYEIFATRWNGSAGRWEAGSGAIFDLSTNARRPETWTSADAAGLAIFRGSCDTTKSMGPERSRTPSASRPARRTITSGRHRIARDRRSTHRRWARGCG